MLGSATGVSALLLYTNGLFVGGLTRDFGLTRVQFGFGVLLVTMALAGANPVVGWLVDRFGAKWLSVAGLLLLSVGFASLGLFIESVNSYFLLQVMVALAGAASGPIAYSKVINETFNRHRGIALGITMTGIGVAAAFIPPALANVIADLGWRSGYYALAWFRWWAPCSRPRFCRRDMPWARRRARSRPRPRERTGSARRCSGCWRAPSR